MQLNTLILAYLNTQKEISGTLEQILETWSKHGENYVEDMADFFGDGFSGFGTEYNEIWKSKEDMVDQQVLEHEQAPMGFSYQVHNIEIYPTGTEQINICCFLMDMEFEIASRKLHLKNYRHSVVFKKIGKKWLVIHWHASKGGKNVDEEVFPGATGPKKYNEVSILFTDFAGFTRTVTTLPPDTLVNELNDIFSSFDLIVQKHGIVKIKTIGDSYMAVAGLSPESNSHARQSISAAKEMIEYLNRRNAISAWKWELRAGIHSGPVIGGFIGVDQTNFDIWGDSVNTASHMETSSAPGMINISAYTYHLIHNEFPCTYRGKIEAKGKGAIDMYFVK